MTLDRSVVEDMIEDPITGFRKHHDLFVSKGSYFLNQSEGFWTYVMFKFD